MAQVIIVSNRLPISVKKVDGQLQFVPSLGGVATGLASYVAERRGSRWIGWPGIASEELTEAEKATVASRLAKDGYVPVFLSQRQIDSFYNGYSNSVLWPLFHGLALNKNEPTDSWWRSYQAVNRLYAETAADLANERSQIWVHDYHLLLVPAQLRELRPGVQIGLFLHIPFPTPARLDHLSAAKKIMSGVLGADLVGFHTTSFVHNFLASVAKANLADAGADQVTYQSRVVKVADFPMGIDYARFASAGRLKSVRQAFKRYRRKYRSLKVIVSIDRLDPSKGLIARLNAYQKFLEIYPEQHGRVIFVMVAAPSRTEIAAYQRLSRRLAKTVKQINDRFGTTSWQPVDYINAALPFEEVRALFQIADVAFIAPLKDGMNLAAKEFVASNKGRGALILSQTAGAAEELSEAIIVNPAQVDKLVEALASALTMRRRELRRRLKQMRTQLSGHTVQHWAKSFIDSLNQPVPGTPHLTRTLNQRLFSHMHDHYRTSLKRLLLLDYDGSLVPFSENYLQAKPPATLLKLLAKLSSDPTNTVVLISGRPAEQLDAWFKDLKLNLVAEHGAAIKLVDKNWRTIEKVETTWKHLIAPALEKYAGLAPGALVEVKPHSLVWHYRSVSPYYAQKYGVIIKRALRPILKRYRLELLPGNKVLEIKNPKVSKGAAAQRWLKQNYDFILAVGDDVTDEELFAVLPQTAYSLKVGHGISRARYRLPTYKEVLSALRQLVSP